MTWLAYSHLGVAKTVQLTTQPASATAGIPFGVQPVGRLVDGSGVLSRATGVTVTASKAGGTGTLSGTLSVQTVEGVFTFTDLKMDTVTSAVTLSFASSGLTGATSSPFNVTQPNTIIGCEVGSYAVTGTAATLTRGPYLLRPFAPGSYAITGTAATLTGPNAGWLANKPANYTMRTELNFSQAVPSGNGGGAIGTGTQRAIPGTDWYIIYDADGSGNSSSSNFDLISDATAPTSTPDAWRLTFQAGTYSDGKTHGNIFTIVSGNPTGFYTCYAIKWSSDFVWHAISNKHLNLSVTGGLWIIQSRESSVYFRVHDMITDTLYAPQINTMPTLGVWHIIEAQIEAGSPGKIRVWIDGVLTSSYNPNITFELDEFGLYGHRGGGGETLPTTCSYDLGHIYLATL